MKAISVISLSADDQFEANSGLTAGLDTVVLYGAHSIGVGPGCRFSV